MFNLFALPAFAVALFVAVGWTFLGDRVLPGNPCGKRARPILLLVVASLTLIFGMIGWSLQPVAGAVGWPGLTKDIGIHATNAVYLAAQHLFLNAPAEPTQNLWIHASRLCAIATVVLIAFEALSRLFADTIQRAMLRRSRNHVVVCGLGHTGFGLVRYLRGVSGSGTGAIKPSAVVVIEADPTNEYIERCRELGAVVLHGDATDENLLQMVRAERAEKVYFVTGSDEANIEGACDLRGIVDTLSPGQSGRPQVGVHLRRPELALLLGEEAAKVSKREQPLDVVCFNVFEQAADDVVTRVLTSRRPRKPGESLHVVIVGMSPMAQLLAVRIAERAHYENGKRTRMTILVSESDRAAVAAFGGRYPRMFPKDVGDAWQPDPAKDHWSDGVLVVDRESPAANDTGVSFAVNGGFAEHAGGIVAPEVLTHIVAITKIPGTIPVVFVCGENDEDACTTACELRHELNTRLPCKPSGDGDGDGQRIVVAAFVPNRPKLAELMEGPGLVVFGTSGGECAIDSLSSSERRPLAEELAAQYFARKYKGQLATQADLSKLSLYEAQKAFAELPLWEQRSNLAAAAHLPIKLAAVGLQVALRNELRNPLGAFTLPDGDRLMLARIEHNRWLAERLMAGWQYGPRSNDLKLRSAMLDWNNLKSVETDKDVDQIDDVIRWLCESKRFGVALATDERGSESARTTAQGAM